MAPEDTLGSMRRWRGATALERSAVAASLAAGLPEFALEAGSDPPRLRHRPSGLAFVIVPGGVLRMGLSDDEAAGLFSGDYLASTAGEALLREGGVVAVMHLMRSAWPVREVQLRPFLMAVSCVPASAPLSTMHGLRLPSESEWEHAVRAGTTSAFFWGDAVPDTLAPVLHPLGLELVGWADELVADLWQPDLIGVPTDGRPRLAGDLPVVRGGAASAGAWPTVRMPPAAAWRLLSARRRPALGEVLWVRPVVSLPPCAVVDDAAPVERPPPRFAPLVRNHLMALHDADPGVRLRARTALRASVCGPAIWTEQGELALSAIVPLLSDARVPDRDALAVLAADLVCGQHAPLCATGLGSADPQVIAALTHAPHMRMRACLERASWAPLLRSTRGTLASSTALLVGMVPELALASLDVLVSRACNPDREVRASMLLACGLGARAAGGSDAVLAVIEAGLADDAPLVRGAAALARLMCEPHAALDDAGALRPAYRAALVAFAALTPTLPWCEGRTDRLVHAVVSAYVPGGLALASALVPTLA